MSERAPRREPKQPRSQETVQVILEATTRLVKKHGVEGWAMKDAADLAGVGVGTLYQYYGSRAALLAAWEEHAWSVATERVRGHFTKIHAEHLPLETAMAAIMAHAFDLTIEHVRQYPLNFGARYSRVEQRRSSHELIAAFVVMALESATEQHRLRPLERLDAGRVVVKTIAFVAHDMVMSGFDPSVVAATRCATVRLLVHGLVKDADDRLVAQGLEKG